jgi:predicted Rossmann fold nucleotide-binding protein DprA/Smf involved in DNA uptake
MEGARLVRGPEDVLELLSPLSPRPAATPEDLRHGAGLAPRLRRTLERVGMGCDTPEKLMALGVDLDEALLELSELEVMGLLGRGDGGRYVPRGASPPS